MEPPRWADRPDAASMNLRDLAERAVWTFVQAFTALLIMAPVLELDVSTLKAAAVSGVSALVTLLSNVARARLAVLPDPGAGLPGLPTGGKPEA